MPLYNVAQWRSAKNSELKFGYSLNGYLLPS